MADETMATKMSSKTKSAQPVLSDERRQKYIETLEKVEAKYERKIKKNQRELKKPYALQTPDADADTPLDKLWLCDIAVLRGRENTELALPRHKQNLEVLRGDIDKLALGRGLDEISPQSRATIFSKKWSLGADWKTVMSAAGGLWY